MIQLVFKICFLTEMGVRCMFGVYPMTFSTVEICKTSGGEIGINLLEDAKEAGAVVVTLQHACIEPQPEELDT